MEAQSPCAPFPHAFPHFPYYLESSFLVWNLWPCVCHCIGGFWVPNLIVVEVHGWISQSVSSCCFALLCPILQS